MDVLDSVGAAAVQRHILREKMSSILLEHDPSAAAAAKNIPFAPSSTIDSEANFTPHCQTKAQGRGHVTQPFPSPGASNFIGLEGMTQTIIDNDDDDIPRDSSTTSPRQLFFGSMPKSARRRSRSRLCREEKHISTQHATKQHLGSIYDMQLDRRATKARKSLRQLSAVPSTTRKRRLRSEKGNGETFNDSASPVKRCLYQNDANESDDELLTPTKMPPTT